MRLEGRVALITGGAGGLGKAFAKALALEGAKIVISDINETPGMDLQQEMEQMGFPSMFIRADVTNRTEVASMIDRAATRWGGVDILVNNAGIMKGGFLHEMAWDQWDKVLNVHLNGVFNCAHFALKYMIEKGYGKIINISSRAAMGLAYHSNYAAAKSGVNGFTRSLALEVAPHNIRVNAISPGWTETDMTRGVSKAFQKERISRIPLGRIGQPEDIAPLLVFLASDDSDFITGQVIYVDGGMSIGLSLT